MRIVEGKVIVCSPGRNFVTLKLVTEDGLHGIGDATLNGRELAVASYLSDHVIPLLIGRDARRIEDTWQLLYRGAYWRRGPVTMRAIAAVDVALWDIKAKAAGMPLYDLLGGKSREGVLVYGHANGEDIFETCDEVERYVGLGYRAVREILNTIWDCKDLISEQLIDYIRTTVVGAGGLTHLRRIADFAALWQVRTGCHGATNLSPVTMGAALHFDSWVPNFGIQEYMRHTPETDAVFPHAYSFADGLMHPGDAPGHGVDIDEALAAKHPYDRRQLPVARLEDGTMWNRCSAASRTPATASPPKSLPYRS